MSNVLKCVLWLVTQTPFHFSPKVFIFGTMVVYGVKMTTPDMTLEAKVKVKYISICLSLDIQIPFAFLIEEVHILYNDYLWRVDGNECF